MQVSPPTPLDTPPHTPGQVGRALLARRAAGLLAGLLVVTSACSAASPRPSRAQADPGDDFYEEEAPLEPSEPDSVNPNGFQAGERPAPPPVDAAPPPVDATPPPVDATPPPVDGGRPDASVDAGRPDASVDAGPPPKVYCPPLGAGDLAITELLLSSRSGSGDNAEWVEITSRRSACWLKLDGLVVESPKGAAFDTATLPAGTELPPLGIVLVAGSLAGARALGLPEPVYAFERTDVLKNDGDRITVRAGTTVIDQLDYPPFSNVTPARSIAFPANCPAAVRSDWSRWSLTFSTYASGAQRGTPGRDNVDVTCY
ncbi:MAG: hypothetical protein IPF92_00670 [Myxococcales bacterium]|jgi:hypothetical protein|nr:hypothetical protein [Myxococcales bacterium]MBL0193645.1 hypothetical protein [Myxococcales bacterium]HQY65096.1 hypothetical protein [Polyangiaceae bacterium]